MFHMDVAKIDPDVAYVYVASVCSKYVSSIFRLMLLQVFYLVVAYVCSDFKVFLQVFRQFWTYVAKINLVLHRL